MSPPIYIIDENETQADTMLELAIGFVGEFLTDVEVICDADRRQAASEVYFRLTRLRSAGQIQRMNEKSRLNS